MNETTDEINHLVVTPEHACKMLDVSIPKLYRLMKSGALMSYRDNRSRKIPIAAIHQYIADRIAEGPNFKRVGRPYSRGRG